MNWKLELVSWVHPGPGGRSIMAEALLKAWNAPKTVAAVEIDATTKSVTHAENTKVTIVLANEELSWTETDGALPFPLPLDRDDKTLALAVRSSDFVEALDQEPLKVTGLTSAHYQRYTRSVVADRLLHCARACHTALHPAGQLTNFRGVPPQ